MNQVNPKTTVVVDTTGLPLGPITNTVSVDSSCYREYTRDMILWNTKFHRYKTICYDVIL